MKKIIRVQFLLIIFAPFFAAKAQENITNSVKALTTIDVWAQGKIPGKGADEVETDMPSRNDGVQRITNVSRPTLTVFPAKNKNAPAMIVSPGGGYKYVAFNKEGTEIAEWLNANGITAVVLKYRTPNNRDGALQDIQRALSLARANAKKWNINPKKLGVMGFSAGGHLSAKASNFFETRTYQTTDKIDKQSCRPDFVILVYPAYLEKDGKIADDLNLKAKIPPTLIVSTEDDKSFVASGKIYHAALDEAKISNEFLLYKTGGHGFGLQSKGESKAWSNAALDWLKKIGVLSAKK